MTRRGLCVSSAVPHPHYHLSSLHWSRLIADPAQVMKLRGYEDARRDSIESRFYQTFLLLDLHFLSGPLIPIFYYFIIVFAGFWYIFPYVGYEGCWVAVPGQCGPHLPAWLLHNPPDSAPDCRDTEMRCKLCSRKPDTQGWHERCSEKILKVAKNILQKHKNIREEAETGAGHNCQ